MTAEQQKKFKYWQWRTLFGTIIGYIFFYLVRKNFSFAMPGLTAEYGIDKSTLGAILSAAGFIYGLSKLVNGMLADRVNGRWHMVTGLAVCAISALLFGYGAEIAAMLAGVTPDITPADGEGWAKFISMFVLVLSVLWIINNIFQGCGFPPCSRRSWQPRCRFGIRRTRLVQVSQASCAVSLLWAIWVAIIAPTRLGLSVLPTTCIRAKLRLKA